jgi:hypothetical protein
MGDSGNGGHLLYRIDLPADDGGLVQRCLEALAARFDDGTVTVDQKVFNPARIWKLYGTTAGKGDVEAAAIGRPHRMARILRAPEVPAVVPCEMLEALAARAPAPPPRKGGRTRHRQSTGAAVPAAPAGAFDVSAWLRENGLDADGPEEWRSQDGQAGRRWVFPHCPWNPEHTNRSAYIVQFASGAVAAGCHHNGCSGNDWRALRDLVAEAAAPRDTAAVRRRLDAVLARVPAEGIEALFRDEALLSDLAWLAEEDPGEFACARAAAGRAGVRMADLDATLAPLRRELRAGPAPDQGHAPCVEVLLALAECADYCHGADGRPYATVPVGDGDDPRRETLCIRNESFRDWLRRCYYRATGRAVPAEALQAVVGVLAARACYDGPARDVRVRVAGAVDGAAPGRGTIYLALGDDQRRVVEATAGGWRIVAAPPVLFRSPQGQRPLPEPARGGSVDDLRPLLNLRDDEWPLVVAWLVQALCPWGPYPLLCLHGEQGVAKSTMARVLKRLTDPSVPILRTLPKDERDLCIGARNAWVLALDNVSELRPWFSDALCRLSTGGGLATRQLYTDEDEAIFDVQCPIILTGIEDLATRPDALDRSIILTLEPIPEPERLTERRYWSRVEAVLPGVLGALLDGVSGALRLLPQVDAEMSSLPRMADFAAWMEAAARALGFQPGQALAAYLVNRDAAAHKALDASILTGPLRTWLAGRQLPWTGTCETLLQELTAVAGAIARHRAWPQTPRALSGALRRLAPILRTLGFAFDADGKAGRGNSRHRTVCISRTAGKPPAQPSPPSPPPPPGQERADGGDGGDGVAGRWRRPRGSASDNGETDGGAWHAPGCEGLRTPFDERELGEEG